MDIGLLLLRLTVGLTLAAHGAQKLFGWFGGPGIDATGLLKRRPRIVLLAPGCNFLGCVEPRGLSRTARFANKGAPRLRPARRGECGRKCWLCHCDDHPAVLPIT
jgi:hypothetical protein